MPTRASAPLGAPCWNDLMTSDPDRASAFYGELFGWESVRGGPELGGYTTCLQDGLPVAGIMAKEPSLDEPDQWSTYLAVADADATSAAVREHGGTVVVEAMQAGDQGSMAFYIDPAGGSFGVWQPGAHVGFQVYEEHGTPTWHELHSTGYAAAVAFYTDVFGWDTQVTGDTDDFRYTVQLVDGVQRAGVMDASSWGPQVTSTWHVYFGSGDVAASLETVTALGGSVLQGIDDTPYGQLATVADPMGAQFKLISLED